ncbi:protein containing Cysteinyl-tRNA synthetase, class Ia, partial [mine drainage metagenome]
MFVCGITPYDSPHIGNLRTFIYFDVIAKYLKVSGFDVFYLQNITDLDDKIITRSNETGIPALELS